MPEGWGPPQRHTLAPCPARESLVSSLKSCFYVMVTYAQQMLLFRSRLGCGPGALRDPLGRTSVVTIFTPNLPSARNRSAVPVRRQRPLPPAPSPGHPPPLSGSRCFTKAESYGVCPFVTIRCHRASCPQGSARGTCHDVLPVLQADPIRHSVRLPCFSLMHSFPPPPRRVPGVFPHRTIVELITL